MYEEVLMYFWIKMVKIVLIGQWYDVKMNRNIKTIQRPNISHTPEFLHVHMQTKLYNVS